MKKVLLPLGLILIAILLFTGCGGDTTTTGTTTATVTATETTTDVWVTTVKPMETTATTTAAASEITRGGILQYIYPYSPTTTPGWPHAFMKFRVPMEKLFQEHPCNHIQVVGGDYVAGLVEVCEKLGIGYKVQDRNLGYERAV